MDTGKNGGTDMTSVNLSKLVTSDCIVLRDGTHHVVEAVKVDVDGDYGVITRTERQYDKVYGTSWYHRQNGVMCGQESCSADIVQIVKKSCGIEMINMNSDELEKAKMPVVQSGYDENMNGKSDPVNPSHYKQGGKQLWDTMKDLASSEEYIGYLKLNVIKYLHRYKKKNGKEDLKKCQTYLQKLIQTEYPE
jgi:hypothetical protein